MTSTVRVMISEVTQEKYFKLQDLIAPHPEFKLYVTDETAVEAMLSKKISNIFIAVGIPAHIKGYQYLREAIKLTIDEPNMANSITKELYPSIAKEFNTTPSKVERAIRHAIEVGWSRGKIENINDIFNMKVYKENEKPTNGEFIALIADKLRLDFATD